MFTTALKLSLITILFYLPASKPPSTSSPAEMILILPFSSIKAMAGGSAGDNSPVAVIPATPLKPQPQTPAQINLPNSLISGDAKEHSTLKPEAAKLIPDAVPPPTEAEKKAVEGINLKSGAGLDPAALRAKRKAAAAAKKQQHGTHVHTSGGGIRRRSLGRFEKRTWPIRRRR
ncbi:hypothetical protein CVT24_000168 [Panaeolus cyanescens]|uniref:Uncharacterized protein n=1 Tax=Panaeolus cyanescens TaxID=181874 RepID=A0A409W3A8_9AGAR|nr:hypothetical protein CVT24_000168 [Panaeolus cyanescens]